MPAKAILPAKGYFKRVAQQEVDRALSHHRAAMLERFATLFPPAEMKRIRSEFSVQIKLAALSLMTSNARKRRGAPPRIRSGELFNSIEVRWIGMDFTVESTAYSRILNQIQTRARRQWLRRAIRLAYRSDVGRDLRRIQRILRGQRAYLAKPPPISRGGSLKTLAYLIAISALILLLIRASERQFAAVNEKY